MSSTEPSKAYIGALTLLLRPLVRGLVSQGITLPFMTTLLKQVYVAAAEDFRISSKRLTDSRVSLLTGVHRKDVKRLRAQEEDAPALSQHASIGAQVVSRWTADPQFQDAQGRPAPLARTGEGSFDSLVETVSLDMRPRTLLDEWLRRSLVEMDDDGRVVLNAGAFVPSGDYDDLAYYFGRNLHDHIAAAVHNLEGAEPPLLERATYYDGLSPQSVNELEALARTIGMEALVKLNKEAHKRAKKDAGTPDAHQRFNFGLYFFRDDVALRPLDEAGEEATP